MKLVASLAELQRATGEITRRDATYSTSFFASPANVEAWIEAGSVYASRSDGALVIFRREIELWRVFHVASGSEELREALASFQIPEPSLPLVADVVGRAQDLPAVLDAYRNSGFRDHARLQRMQHRGSIPREETTETGIEAGTEIAASPIRGFMKRWFDPLSERIQTWQELAECARAGRLLVAREGDVLAGFLIFEETGLSSVVRYWHVEPGHRGKGVGARLMRAFLRRSAGSRRIVLWVLRDNEDAIAKYQHYGFHDDGVVDQILTRLKGPLP